MSLKGKAPLRRAEIGREGPEADGLVELAKLESAQSLHILSCEMIYFPVAKGEVKSQ